MSPDAGEQIRTLAALYDAARDEADDRPAALARAWVARAACVFLCEGNVTRSSAALATQARDCADKLRQQQKQAVGSLGFFRKKTTGPTVELQASEVLDSLADQLGRRAAASGLFAALSAEFADWRGVPWLAPLVSLQAQLLDVGSGAEALLQRVVLEWPEGDGESPPHSSDDTASESWTRSERAIDQVWGDARTEPERAAALIVVRLADVLSRVSDDDENWRTFDRWLRDWFDAFRAASELRFGTRPKAGSFVEIARAPRSDRAWLTVEWPASLPRTRKTAPAPSASAPAPQKKSTPATEEADPARSIFAALDAPPEFDSRTAGQSFPPAAWRDACGSAGHSSRVGPGGRQELTRWLESTAGETWLNRLLREVLARNDENCRNWWSALKSNGFCRVFPEVDAESRRVSWPSAQPWPWPGVKGSSSERPENEVVAVERFATAPERARFTISDGPESGPIAAFERFSAAAESLRPDLLAEGVWAQARNFTLHPPSTADAAALAPMLMVLDRFARRTTASDKTVRFNDPILQALLTWADALGAQVTPRLPAAFEGSLRDELVRQNCAVSTAYGNSPAGKLAAIDPWGLVWKGTEIRRGRATLSAGPAPADLVAMAEAAQSLPEAAPLRPLIEALRDAAAGGYLQAAALELNDVWWSDALIRLRDRPEAAAIEQRLTSYLQSVLGLASFVPENVLQHPPEWCSIVPGSRVVTGVVQEVFRPGWQDAEGRLIRPAVVKAQ